MFEKYRRFRSVRSERVLRQVEFIPSMRIQTLQDGETDNCNGSSTRARTSHLSKEEKDYKSKASGIAQMCDGGV